MKIWKPESGEACWSKGKSSQVGTHTTTTKTIKNICREEQTTIINTSSKKKSIMHHMQNDYLIQMKLGQTPPKSQYSWQKPTVFILWVHHRDLVA